MTMTSTDTETPEAETVQPVLPGIDWKEYE